MIIITSSPSYLPHSSTVTRISSIVRRYKLVVVNALLHEQLVVVRYVRPLNKTLKTLLLNQKVSRKEGIRVFIRKHQILSFLQAVFGGQGRHHDVLYKPRILKKAIKLWKCDEIIETRCR